MIKEAILSVVITLYYGTNDVISVYSVEVPVPAGIVACHMMEEKLTDSHFIVQDEEMAGMRYRFTSFCNNK